MSSDISPIFSKAMNTPTGIGSSAIAKQTKKDVERLAARTEFALLKDQSRAMLAAAGMANTGILVGRAKALASIDPEGGEFYAMYVQAYVMGSIHDVGNHC